LSEFIDLLISVGIASAMIRLMTPLLLAGVGELFVQKSGVLNLGVEGIMLFGAFFAFIGTFFTGNVGYGLALAIVVGVAINLLFAFLTVSMAVDQVVTGLAINIAAIGTTSYLYRATFPYATAIPAKTETIIEVEPIPFLSSIPYIGPALFSHTVFTYAALLLVPVAAFMISRTSWGLRVKAIGEDPHVADLLGLNVVRTRYFILIMEGVLAALAGSMLSISQYNMFLDNMTQGRGYIVVALIILGRWSPINFLAGSLFFAYIDALQLRIQAAGITIIPYQFALMLPYLASFAALALVGRRVKGPASLAKPYKKVK